MLKSAWEIALEKHEKHEELGHITAELLEHVALLEEGWDAIRPQPLSDERDEPAAPHRQLAA